MSPPGTAPGPKAPARPLQTLWVMLHARDLIELSALVAQHGPLLVLGPPRVPEAAIDAYWVASKCRLDRWARALKDPPTVLAGWVEEILASEMLTRVWTAALCAYDRVHRTDRMEPVARSVWLGQAEARHRLLSLLVRSEELPPAEIRRLNTLRLRVEGWSDVLVGRLASLADVAEFAVDPYRARDFARDLAAKGRKKGGRLVWPLCLASLRSAFRHAFTRPSPNADLNARIASSILAFFQPEVFDGTGLFTPLWVWRLMQTATDAQEWIEDLLGTASGTPQPRWLPPRLRG